MTITLSPDLNETVIGDPFKRKNVLARTPPPGETQEERRLNPVFWRLIFEDTIQEDPPKGDNTEAGASPAKDGSTPITPAKHLNDENYYTPRSTPTPIEDKYEEDDLITSPNFQLVEDLDNPHKRKRIESPMDRATHSKEIRRIIRELEQAGMELLSLTEPQHTSDGELRKAVDDLNILIGEFGRKFQETEKGQERTGPKQIELKGATVRGDVALLINPQDKGDRGTLKILKDRIPELGELLEDAKEGDLEYLMTTTKTYTSRGSNEESNKMIHLLSLDEDERVVDDGPRLYKLLTKLRDATISEGRAMYTSQPQRA
ncbi:hypothetical protein JTB14_038424 [Gonioctena quinquepunctata]|nr:hypothetical protein JTB14_038424 [Gonioctena quinquepunctata]